MVSMPYGLLINVCTTHKIKPLQNLYLIYIFGSRHKYILNPMNAHTVCEFSKIFISRSLIGTYHLRVRPAEVGYRDAPVRHCSTFLGTWVRIPACTLSVRGSQLL